MDLASASGAPEEITLGGKPYSVRLLTMRERGALQAFLKRELVSPITRTAIAIQEAKEVGTPLDRDIEDRLWDRAEAAALTWPPKFGTQAWFDAINAIIGGPARLLHEVISKTDPAFTIEQGEKLTPGVTPDEWSDLVRVAFWGQPPAPKGEGATNAPSPPPMTSSPSATTGAGSSAS